MTNESSSGSGENAGDVSVSPLEGPDAERYVQAVLSSPEYERFRSELAQERAATFTAQDQEATALRIESGQERVVSVHVPVPGGAGQSFFGAVLDPDTAAVRRTVSGLFDRTPEGSVAVVVQRDGELALEAVMSPEGAVLSGTAVASDLIDCINDCLDEAGINQFLITAIGAACGAVCAITVGTGCIGCIAAVIGTISGTLLGCLRRC